MQSPRAAAEAAEPKPPPTAEQAEVDQQLGELDRDLEAVKAKGQFVGAVRSGFLAERARLVAERARRARDGATG